MINSSSRLSGSTKFSGIKVEIQINEKVKLGKISYRPEDTISKVLTDLKRIRILPEHIEDGKVKFHNSSSKELKPSSEFSSNFDFTESNHFIKLTVSDRSIDLDDVSRRVDDYIRSNKKKKQALKEMSETEKLIKNLKQIFFAIRERNYQELSTLCVNNEYMNVIYDFSSEHERLTTINTLCQTIIDKVIQSKNIEVDTSALQKIDSQAKEKLQARVRKLNSLKKDERLNNQMNEIKGAAFKKDIESAKNEIKGLQEKLQEKEKEMDSYRLMYQKFKVDTEIQKAQYEANITNLQVEVAALQNKCYNYQSTIMELKEKLSKKESSFNHHSDFVNYFSTDTILSEIALNPKYCQNLLHRLKQCLSSFKKFKPLYSKDNITTGRFQKIVNFKQNVFLIAKTVSGRIFGGFSSLPFDPNKRKHSSKDIINNIKSFLFNVYNNQINFFPIKQGFDSVQYDDGFIIFGNEQICIDVFKNKAESLLAKYLQSHLHYSISFELKEKFLSDNNESSVDLISFQIYQITVN